MPGSSTLSALEFSGKKVNFILDADIRSFFNEVSQEWVARFLEHRIGDKRISGSSRNGFRAGYP